MLNVTKVLISHITERAQQDFAQLYPGADGELLAWVIDAIEETITAIGASDALYHNAEHTAHVTLVGLEILRVKAMTEGSVPPATWANVVVALLCHDIGYVRDLSIEPARGLELPADGARGSDAVLMPLHVSRGKSYIARCMTAVEQADVGLINACIERTRFPVPDDAWYEQTGDLPGLVRAADLIGQLSDPRYLSKLSAIFFEFEENGYNSITGYERPGDLLTGYPAFFERCVRPYIGDAIAYLGQSAEGQDILGHLYGNLQTACDALNEALPSVAVS